MTDQTPNGRRRAPLRARNVVIPDAEIDAPTTQLPSATALLDRPQADDMLSGPPADEAPSTVDLSHTGHPVLRPGEAETDASGGDERITLREAFDFSAI